MIKILITSLLLFSSINFAAELLSARVVQIVPQEDKTILVLDKGSVFGVKVGDSAFFTKQSNTTFKITEASKFRSKAIGMRMTSPVYSVDPQRWNQIHGFSRSR